MHTSVEIRTSTDNSAAIRTSTDQPLKYRAKDVALHASADDCWVIVAGRVFDVTKFLSSHPGGAQALSKPGRAGCDVTPAFERIGHSAHARTLLETMLVGVLDDDLFLRAHHERAEREFFCALVRPLFRSLERDHDAPWVDLTWARSQPSVTEVALAPHTHAEVDRTQRSALGIEERVVLP